MIAVICFSKLLVPLVEVVEGVTRLEGERRLRTIYYVKGDPTFTNKWVMTDGLSRIELFDDALRTEAHERAYGLQRGELA
jgi:hypothetical protein